MIHREHEGGEESVLWVLSLVWLVSAAISSSPCVCASLSSLSDHLRRQPCPLLLLLDVFAHGCKVFVMFSMFLVFFCLAAPGFSFVVFLLSLRIKTCSQFKLRLRLRLSALGPLSLSSSHGLPHTYKYILGANEVEHLRNETESGAWTLWLWLTKYKKQWFCHGCWRNQVQALTTGVLWVSFIYRLDEVQTKVENGSDIN